ncbi:MULTISPECIES: adenylate/guanylate cyclase domain-containing protein [Leptospira]|uniref:Adenylate/guanylate cyclase domain-containing protein n=1 Tax=Leptospira santarosai TaxID=28183 RepID=A0AB73M5F0_9LEPT|nr:MULTISPECIES: adenylate/guanylate cyclase domain-containing protein [Leptospira]AVV79537.1 Adenylate/guanylate cyclase catalytic domain protein [Leptospira santarosai]EKO77947.1 adenylate/guanylate cyclase catalytic domain protein [Leptospira sp. Fiocruz LV3954]ONF84674.1 adenylate/guanylate cyclase domain-containing protein [Leptospira santarosai serovar Grippotyphosa]ONF93859.1 adenylate/guanylate cyclase domain-containing protein [Leptospira santarosai]
MLETHHRYLPFGTSGVLLFISASQSNSRIDTSVLSEEITKKEIGTVCFVSTDSSIDANTLESISPSVTVLSIVIPPGPETNDSVYSIFLQIQKFLKRGNLLFSIAPDCETRFPLLLSKLLLAASPSMSNSELQSQIFHFGYSSSDQATFRKYLAKQKEQLSFLEIPPGEFSVSIHLVQKGKHTSTSKIRHEDSLTEKPIKAKGEKKNVKLSFESSPIHAIEIDDLDDTQKLKEIPVSTSELQSKIVIEENTISDSSSTSEEQPQIAIEENTISDSSSTSELQPQIVIEENTTSDSSSTSELQSKIVIKENTTSDSSSTSELQSKIVIEENATSDSSSTSELQSKIVIEENTTSDSSSTSEEQSKIVIEENATSDSSSTSEEQSKIVIKENTISDSSSTSKSEKDENVSTAKSQFPLQIKLMAVISVLMTFTVSTIIFFASSAFREDSEVRVLQNNLNLVNILGLKIKTDIKEILSNGKQIVGALVKGKEGISFADIFFQNDPDFIYAGLYQIEGDSPFAINQFYNEPYLSELGVSPKTIFNLVQNRPGFIQKSVLTGGRMENLSAEFKEPIFAIAIPSSGSNSNVLVLILRLEKFLNAFQKQDISEVFMVNGEGDLIAHSDAKLLQSNTNFMNLPIVESMVKSSENTKQIEYKDKDGKAWFGSYQKLGFGGAAVISIVPEDKAFEAVYKIQKTNLLIMGIALCLALLIVFFFAKTITKPILHLLQATKEIARGNFKIKIRSTTKDEVGLLTDYFVDMGKGLEEREKVKDALGRFVNKEIAEMVLKHELTLGGERKMCAIFFSDIRSFTSISEKLQPEEVVEFLNEYMTEMVHCVNETHGIVDKFIGDAIMATWGATKTSDKDAENAVNGSLMMREALLKFNQGRGGEKKPIIQIGCGLNYGPVIAGQIGSEQRLEYTVIGDAVNLASRVEALNKPFGTDILITQNLLDHVPDIFNVEKMQSIKVKGKEEPQVIYAVLGRKDDPNCPKTVEELRQKIGIVWEPPKKDKAKDPEAGEVKYEILD